MRRFATTLHFYSAKAYRYVRKVFNDSLPSERTITSWYKSVDGSPGISSEALVILEAKADQMKAKGGKLLVCLSMDEVAIRQLVEWNKYSNSFEGVVDLGGISESRCAADKVQPAKEALVFMATGIEESWKIPVGYFLISGLNAEQKRNLV